ncbi:MAG: hypothetical protein KIT75_03480 [Planctomycetota bacterium]|nr:hypothetical protein [Planctomycetota bacterium]
MMATLAQPRGSGSSAWINQRIAEQREQERQAALAAAAPFMPLPTAGEIILRRWRDAEAYLTQPQRNLWLRAAGSTWHTIRALLDAGQGNIGRDGVLRLIGEISAGNPLQAYLVAKHGWLNPRTLEDANAAMAAKWAATLPMQAVRPFAIQLGAKPDANADQLRTVVAVYASQLANTWGILLDDWIEHYKRNPDTAHPSDLSGTFTTGERVPVVAGSGSFWSDVKQFFKRPLRVIDRFIEDVGTAIKKAAAVVLDTETSIPWLSQFFLKPLGFHLQARLLFELGNMVEARSFSAFKEQALVLDTGKTLQAAGQALLVAAPMLPPPYNVAAAALGALSVAAGAAIINLSPEVQAAKQQQANTAAAQQSEAATAAANQQQQQQAAQTAYGKALGLVEAGQYHQTWIETGGGRYWSTLVPSGGQWLPAWVWITDQGWVWTGAFQ